MERQRAEKERKLLLAVEAKAGKFDMGQKGGMQKMMRGMSGMMGGGGPGGPGGPGGMGGMGGMGGGFPRR